MRWRTTPRFDADWRALPSEHRRAFRDRIPAFAAACDDYAAAPGTFRWPARLRVAPLTGAPGIWEMTWSFAGPDGRATFEFGTDAQGRYLLWRRIGGHAIFRKP